MTTYRNSRIKDEPTLVLDKLGRSLCVRWPDGTVCDTCEQPGDQGYVGPATELDSVVVPAPGLGYRCRDCARNSLGLMPDELSGHTCGVCPSDDLHLDRVISPSSKPISKAELDALGPAGRIQFFDVDEGYADRGWRVTSAEWNGRSWDVEFVRRRDLW